MGETQLDSDEHRQLRRVGFGGWTAGGKRKVWGRLGFLSLRNVQTIEPTTAWTAVRSPSASTRYSFLQLCGLGRALWANSGEGSAQ